jgi:hypothetical protein
MGHCVVKMLDVRDVRVSERVAIEGRDREDGE